MISAPLAYSINGAVKASGFCRSVLYQDIAAGKLRTRKRGRRTIILAEELSRYLHDLPESDPPTKERPGQ